MPLIHFLPDESLKEVGEPSERVANTGHGFVAHRQKKAEGNAAHQQGDECVEGADVPAIPASSISQRCRGHRLVTAQKWGAFPKHPRS